MQEHTPSGPDNHVPGGKPTVDPSAVSARLRNLSDSGRSSGTKLTRKAPTSPSAGSNLPSAGGKSLDVANALRRRLPDNGEPSPQEQKHREPLHDAVSIADQLAQSLRSALDPDVLEALRERL